MKTPKCFAKADNKTGTIEEINNGASNLLMELTYSRENFTILIISIIFFAFSIFYVAESKAFILIVENSKLKTSPHPTLIYIIAHLITSFLQTGEMKYFTVGKVLILPPTPIFTLIRIA
ncbi:hypothetical protein X798_06246 [Onchocerca flexuosa]|uniref:Uncharacterized protein n=1 Tax=Onchocerca flexuosa TaxID=387005 RepID=A0A238BQ04_9BILA|nr:hypothetical protein X798_06246 [Onchocerca flexuosa]